MAKRGKLVNTVARVRVGHAGAKPVAAGLPQHKPPKPKHVAAPYTPPAAAPQAAQAPTPQPFQFAPDAQYLAELAQSNYQRQQQINQLDTQDRTQRADTEEAIRRLLARAPEDRRKITAGANTQGLLYGGHHAKQLDDYQGEVTRTESDQRLQLQRDMDARAAIRQALLEGAPLEEAALRASAVDRQVGRDQDAAAVNMLAPPPPAPAPAPARRAPVAVASGPQVGTRGRRRRRR